MVRRLTVKTPSIGGYITILINHPMKKIYVLTLVAITLIYSSCTVEKRHYMSGYHVEWNHKGPKIGGDGNTIAEANESAETSNNMTHTETTITERPANYVNYLEKNITPPTESKSVTEIPKKVVSNSKANIESNNQAIKESNNKVIAPTIRNSNSTSHSVANDENSDTDLVILVILAILLPPLAVFLKEGSWNSRCWIDLILCLLFFIPGVIYALLIVLEAI
jgi:uncharacterized membrane protein YqaE (UPF0057 family)